MRSKFIQKVTENKQGFTIVELLIGLTVLSTVIAVGYLFFFFGYNTFNTGESRSWVRANVRLAANFITDELRYPRISNCLILFL